ncbi:hypothetical protein C8R43DRAFT_1148626 [Mycena crocata]|nr:hypothetical protein C8R43DRAFT_1148626 [Mycena crocata]
MSVVSVTPTSPSRPYVAKFRKSVQGKPTLVGGKAHSNSDPVIDYDEYRSWGMPPPDIGRPGDVYLDVVSPYIIYCFNEAGWEPWNPRGSDGSQTLRRHPNYTDRYLWINQIQGHAGLFWLTPDTLKKELYIIMDNKYPMDQNMQDCLSGILSPYVQLALDASPDSAGNKKCCELEVKRRRAHGVPVDVPQCSPHLRVAQLDNKEVSGKFHIAGPTFATAPELTAEIQDLENQNKELRRQSVVSKQHCENLTAERRIQVDNLIRAHRFEVESLNYVFDDLRGHFDQALSRVEELESGTSRELELQERLDAAERTIQRLQEESSQRQSALQTGLVNWAASLREISKDLRGLQLLRLSNVWHWRQTIPICIPHEVLDARIAPFKLLQSAIEGDFIPGWQIAVFVPQQIIRPDPIWTAHDCVSAEPVHLWDEHCRNEIRQTVILFQKHLSLVFVPGGDFGKTPPLARLARLR